MSDLIVWLLTIYFVGLAAFPISYLALPNLMDRGFGLTRPIGMLILGATVWLLSLLGVLPNVEWSWWLISLIFAATGWSWLIWRERSKLRRFIRHRWLQLVVTEGVFLAFFLVFAGVKAMNPDIDHTEKPMDLMMLNAVVGSEHAPPNDLWLSGYPIAYYYFGYWMFGGLAQMSGIQLGIAYNLALASIAALSAAAIFSLVSNLVQRDGATTTQMLTSGLIATVLLLVISNLNGLWEILSLASIGTEGFYDWLGIKGVDLTDPGSSWRPEGFWWWWASSRIINRFGPDGAELDFTIQEFPYFSLMLGDLHPHLMSIPFVLTMISVIANLLFSRIRWKFRWFKQNPVTSLVVIVAVGATGFINTWDMLWTLLALGGVVYFKSYRENGRVHLAAIRASIPPFLLIVLIGAAFFSNYYFVTADSQIQFPPIIPTRYATRPIHFFTVWGGLIAIMVVFSSAILVPTVKREIATIREHYAMPKIVSETFPWFAALFFVGFLYLAWTVSHYSFNDNAVVTDLITRLPLSVVLGALFVVFFLVTYRRGMRGADDGAQVSLVLLTISLMLLYVVELFRMHDFFGGRHNTVFKFYYEVWIFFSVVGGYAIYYWMRHHPSFVGRIKYLSATGIFVVALLIAVSLYYPLAATATKSFETSTEFTLDGLKFLESTDTSIPEAMEWIRENISNDDVIVEASGTSYSKFGRFSGWTGRPTILGWSGHQSQWRGGNELWADRERHVERIYNSSDYSEIQTLIDRYEADYLVISPNEREKYTELDVAKFDRIGSRVFENQEVIIFALGE